MGLEDPGEDMPGGEISQASSDTLWGSRVTVPEDVVFRELDGEAVLLHLAKGEYFGLNAVGTRMWNLLCALGRPDAVLDTLVEEYETERDRLSHELGEFIKDLTDRGLLTLH